MRISKHITARLSPAEAFRAEGVSSFSGAKATVQVDQVRLTIKPDGSRVCTVEGFKIRKNDEVGSVHTAILVEQLPESIVEALDKA